MFITWVYLGIGMQSTIDFETILPLDDSNVAVYLNKEVISWKAASKFKISDQLTCLTSGTLHKDCYISSLRFVFCNTCYHILDCIIDRKKIPKANIMFSGTIITMDLKWKLYEIAHVTKIKYMAVKMAAMIQP